jgi:hypothetical protein
MRIKDEAQSGIYDEQTYEMFGDFCNYTVKKYVEFMNNHKGKMPIIGYGAPAKGNTFLNYCGIGPDFIIDDSPAKQGKFTPGLGIPVYDSSYLRQFNDEEQVIFVPLAWNFFEEIVNKIAKIRKRKSDIFVRIMPDFAVGIDMHNQYGLYRDFR